MNLKRITRTVLSPEEKRSILDAAGVSGNVARLCREFSISRTSFYRIKKAYDALGAEALVPKPRRKPKMPNAFPPSVVEKVLAETRKHPQWSYVALGAWLRRQGMVISNSGVRKVWERHGLTRREARKLILRENGSGGSSPSVPESRPEAAAPPPEACGADTEGPV